MLPYIAGYSTTQSSGAQFKHIVYIGTDGHLHDLVAPLKTGIWQYNLDITAANNATMAALNAAQPNVGYGPIPNAQGPIGVSVTLQSVPQIIYLSDDGQLHATFPVAEGYFYAGMPDQPPDADTGDPFGDGFDGDPGGEPTPGTSPSPAGWNDVAVTSSPNYPLRFIDMYTSATLVNDTTLIFLDHNFELTAVVGQGSGWSYPAVDISVAAKQPSSRSGGYFSAMSWAADESEHVFTVTEAGGIEELWTKSQPDELTAQWNAHDVLYQVKSVTGSSAQMPLAPPADTGAVPAAFVDNDTKNVAYIDSNGNINLCTHALGGEWEITYISEIAKPPPGAPPLTPNPKAVLQGQLNNINLLGYASDRTHIIFSDGGQIFDLWGSVGSWNWGKPLQKDQLIPGTGPGTGSVTVIGAPVNEATGMAAFVSPNHEDSIVYIGVDGSIWELVLQQGASVLPSGDPDYVPSIGLPWTARAVSVMAAVSPNYVPPEMKT